MATSVALRRVGNRLASAKSKTGLPQCSQATSAWARHQATPAIFAILARCRAAAKLRGRAGLERRLAGEGGSEAKAQHLEHRIVRGMAEGTLTVKERVAKAKELRAKLAGSRHARALQHPRHEGPVVPPSRRTVAVAARTVKAHGPVPESKLHQVESIRLSGNTYAHRERIAAMGATWSTEHKAWVVPGHAIRPELHGQIARDLHDLSTHGVKIESDLAMVHRKPRPLPERLLKATRVVRREQPEPSQRPNMDFLAAMSEARARRHAEQSGKPPIRSAEPALLLPASEQAKVTVEHGKVPASKPTKLPPGMKAARHIARVTARAPEPGVYHATRAHILPIVTAHFVRGAAPPPVPMEGRGASLRGGRPVLQGPWAFTRLAALENRTHVRVKAAEAEVESNPLVGGKRVRPGYAQAARKLDRALARRKRIANARMRLNEQFTPGYSRGGVYTGD